MSPAPLALAGDNANLLIPQMRRTVDRSESFGRVPPGGTWGGSSREGQFFSHVNGFGKYLLLMQMPVSFEGSTGQLPGKKVLAGTFRMLVFGLRAENRAVGRGLQDALREGLRGLRGRNGSGNAGSLRGRGSRGPMRRLKAKGPRRTVLFSFFYPKFRGNYPFGTRTGS